ncbi:MAG: TlpA family protein disulfide reductase [Saprospiraceae bacterium]
MTKNILAVIFCVMALIFMQCKNKVNSQITGTEVSSDATSEEVSEAGNTVTFKGKIVGSGGLKAYLDKMKMDATEPLMNTQIAGDGSIDFQSEDITPGMYRLRIGTKNVLFILDGTENEVIVDANLATVQQFEYTVQGSKNTSEYVRIVKQFIKEQPSEEDIANYIDTTSYALVGLSIATDVLNPKRFQFAYLTPERIIEIHSGANKKVAAVYPNSDLIAIHQQFINEVKISLGQQMIRVGAIPPNIAMTSPQGKTYSLADLKGQVVLLDFWASWCRPCRFNNPELVSIYKKYKDQGFTVYSVSLDRNAQSWEQAILKDGLEWEYHVSDLKYWQSEPAKMYGVNSIPRTFLLDKDGRIAAINPQGPQLEQAVKQLING